MTSVSTFPVRSVKFYGPLDYYISGYEGDMIEFFEQYTSTTFYIWKIQVMLRPLDTATTYRGNQITAPYEGGVRYIIYWRHRVEDPTTHEVTWPEDIVDEQIMATHYGCVNTSYFDPQGFPISYGDSLRIRFWRWNMDMYVTQIVSYAEYPRYPMKFDWSTPTDAGGYKHQLAIMTHYSTTPIFYWPRCPSTRRTRNTAALALASGSITKKPLEDFTEEQKEVSNDF